MSPFINHYTIYLRQNCRQSADSLPREVLKNNLAAIKYCMGDDQPSVLFPDALPKIGFQMRALPGGGLKCTAMTRITHWF